MLIRINVNKEINGISKLNHAIKKKIIIIARVITILVSLI